MVNVEVVDSFQTSVSVSHHMALLPEYITIRRHLHYNLSMVHIYVYVYILAFVTGNIPLI